MRNIIRGRLNSKNDNLINHYTEEFHEKAE